MGQHPAVIADVPALEAVAVRAGVDGISVWRFGETGEIGLRELKLHANSTSYLADLDGKTLPVTLAAPGRHMAMNALACLAAVHALGGDLRVAARALSGFLPGEGRGALRPLPHGAALLDESYNASSASVRAALEVLSLLPARRRMAVLGDMLELGEFALSEHLSLVPRVRESADIVYCCGEMMNRLYKELPHDLQGACEADATALAPLVAGAVLPGDVVLVKGSYGSRMRDVVAALLAASPGDAAR